MIRRLLFLLGGSAAFCLLVGLPARHLGGGDQAVVFLATALALCLAPAVVTLLWGERALRQSADQQLVMVLGGTGVLCVAMAEALVNVGVFNDDRCRRAAVELVRWSQAEIVITASPADYHPDHEAASQLIRDACFASSVPNYATGTRGRITWEEHDGEECIDVHIRAILDDKGHIMVLALHNTDNGDGWERLRNNDFYFHNFSEKIAFPLAINIIYYSMTH